MLRFHIGRSANRLPLHLFPHANPGSEHAPHNLGLAYLKIMIANRRVRHIGTTVYESQLVRIPAAKDVHQRVGCSVFSPGIDADNQHLGQIIFYHHNIFRNPYFADSLSTVIEKHSTTTAKNRYIYGSGHALIHSLTRSGNTPGIAERNRRWLRKINMLKFLQWIHIGRGFTHLHKMSECIMKKIAGYIIKPISVAVLK